MSDFTRSTLQCFSKSFNDADLINSTGVGTTHKSVNSIPAESLPCRTCLIDSGSVPDMLYYVSKV